MSELCAGDIMQRAVVVVPQEAALADCAHLLCEKHITGVPVVDEVGSLVGIISQTDLLRHEDTLRAALRQPPPWDSRDRRAETGGWRVGDIMSREVISGSPDTPVDCLAGVMISHGIHRVVIVSGRSVVGIVTTMDLLRLVASREAQRRVFAVRGRDYSNLYSNRHEKVLMRVEHIERIKDLQRRHAMRVLHEHQGSLTASDVVNASLDFVFEHLPESFQFEEEFGEAVARGMYRRILVPAQRAIPASQRLTLTLIDGDSAVAGV